MDSLPGRRLRPLAAVAACLIAAIWAQFQYASAAREESWRREIARATVNPERVEPLLRGPDAPHASESRARLATLAEEALFPPAYREASTLIEGALRVDALNPELWMYLSRARLFTGNAEQARAALERSDELDPMFPGRRLASIRLWILLGERDRAMAAAKRIAAIGGRSKARAAGELMMSGFGARETFDALGGAELRGAELAEMIGALKRGRQEEISAIIDGLPAEVTSAPEFRAAVLQEVSDPLIYDLALRFWSSRFAALPANASFAPTWIEDGTLPRDIPTKPQPLGWQPEPLSIRVTGIWRTAAPDAPSGADGVVELRLDNLTGERGATLPWDAYLLPVRAQTSATLSMMVKIEPPEDARAMLRAVRVGDDGDKATRGTWSPRGTAGWQELRVPIPALERASRVRLSLVMNQSGSGRETSVYATNLKVLLDGGGPEVRP